MHRFCSLTITVFHVLSLESESWKLINNIYSIYVTVIHFIYHTVYRMTGFRQAVPLSLLHSYYHGVSFRCLSGLLVHCLSGLLVLFFLRFFDALYFPFSLLAGVHFPKIFTENAWEIDFIRVRVHTCQKWFVLVVNFSLNTFKISDAVTLNINDCISVEISITTEWFFNSLNICHLYLTFLFNGKKN